MKKNISIMVAGICCVSLVLPFRALCIPQAGKPQSAEQRPTPPSAPVTNVTVDGNEAMFTTMCALLAAGFEANVSTKDWRPFRVQFRDRMEQQRGPAVDAVRDFYKKHELNDTGAMLSQYVWFGLVAGPAPKFEPAGRRDELPPEVLALEGFSEILSAYYQEQKIGVLWRQVQPIYNQDIAQLHEAVSNVVFVAGNYLREIMDASNPRTFSIIVEPLVGRITNVRNFGDHYAIVLSGADDVPVDVVRHAYLHFLLDPLPLQYSHVVAVKRPLFDLAIRAPRLNPDVKDDFFSYFAECLVRAVDLKLQRLAPGEREAALDTNDKDGYVLVRPLFRELSNFEKSEPSMRLYFPDMVRAIDLKVETARVQALTFAPAETASKPKDVTAESVARHSALLLSTVPNDPEAIAALTEGERHIADRNARAAEASFRSVLAKYPDQPRAWYGLGLVALLDHDAPRAERVFGRLTTGEHEATQDPLVLAWSHVYLARVFEEEGKIEQAKAEYQAALVVKGAPENARQAAQKALTASDARKPTERP